MLIADLHELPFMFAQRLRRRAMGSFFLEMGDSPKNLLTIQRCRAYHPGTGTRLLLTRDVGYHSSGWWKNPDYERCWHLSLSFVDVISGESRSRDRRLTKLWIEAVYSEEERKLIWTEPPHYAEGKAADVWHYRVFCDPAWAPLKPRGEVYSKHLTERGWLSFSDVQAQLQEGVDGRQIT